MNVLQLIVNIIINSDSNIQRLFDWNELELGCNSETVRHIEALVRNLVIIGYDPTWSCNAPPYCNFRLTSRQLA